MNEHNTSEKSNLVQIFPLGESSIMHPFTGTCYPISDWFITGDHCMGQILDENQEEVLIPFPYHQGVISAFTYNKDTAEAHPKSYWNAHKFANKFENPTNDTVLSKKSGENQFNISQPSIILNCLTPYFGDAVSLLFRTQIVKSRYPDHNLIVIVPRNIEFLIPKFVSIIWVFTQSLSAAGDWNTGMAETIRQWVENLGTKVYIPMIFEPVSLKVHEVEAFTRYTPFSIAHWDRRLEKSAEVTFVCRTDRIWCAQTKNSRLYRRLNRFSAFRKLRAQREERIQNQRLKELAENLKKRFRRLNMTVIGQGVPILTDLFQDLRQPKLDREYENTMLETCAKSHVTIGVHGSHMILPTSLAGSSIHLYNKFHEHHDLLDCVVTEQNPRLATIRHQRYPVAIDSDEVASKVTKLLINMSLHEQIFTDNFSNNTGDKLNLKMHDFRTGRERVLESQDTGKWGHLLYQASCYFN